MHAPIVTRAVGEAVGLLNRQGVHIGPKADRARRIADPQPADDTRPADAAMHLAAELSEKELGFDLNRIEFPVTLFP